MGRNIFIRNARQLLTCAGKAPKRGIYLRDLKMLLDGAVAIEDGIITEVGPTSVLEQKLADKFSSMEWEIIDASDKVVLPGYVDPHTHALFVGSREDEFEKRIEGKTYMDILLGGGGILNTVNKVRKSTEDDLIRETIPRLDNMVKQGTTTCEIKSGYGLDTENELKMLRAIRRLQEYHPVEVASTFLGAHAIPPEYLKKRPEFTEYVLEEMLPRVAEEGLAEFCDVFCEEKVFPLEDTRRILEKAKALGMKLKIHADEIDAVGGSALAIELGAVSADHLLQTDDETIRKFAESDTIAVLLPGTAYSLMSESYARARKMIEEGTAIALATDCNPGSCYTESMPTIMSIACMRMKLLPSEAINAATINAACAIGRQDRIGSIEPGKQADIQICEIPDYKHLVYHFGVSHVRMVIKKGRIIYEATAGVHHDKPAPEADDPTDPIPYEMSL